MKRKAFALLALAAVVGLLSAGAAAAKRAVDVPISGAGSTFVAPARPAGHPGARIGVRLHAPVRLGRLGHRHRRHHGRIGRLRRLRRAAEPDPGDGLQRLRPDPVGALGDHALRTTSPASRNQIHLNGPTIAKIYLGHDHELERPGDRRAEPEAARSRTWRSRRSIAPTARAHLRLHRLPLDGESGTRKRRSATGRR